MAKPCLLVKKSVLNCRTTELKVLCRSLGRAGPLSSFSSTPLSTGPSQMRSTSWTSSVSNTRKCSLHGERGQRSEGAQLLCPGLPVTEGRSLKTCRKKDKAVSGSTLVIPVELAAPTESLAMGQG